ncbi:hypothetical protein AB0L00_05020 [Actinoallomurus sp. NPDC052308]|uniref:hypothetical protein n=1 Tax=Actinoallomurus sp. NPDC052308 TaxID=3155530 RepID=UPI00343DD2E5
MTIVLEVEAGELLLVRFSPMNVPKLVEDAEDSADELVARGEKPIYSISTFGLVKTPDASVEDLIVRICAEAPCGGKTIWLTTGSALTEAGFEPRLSEPPPHHYDVVLGERLLVSDVERLVKSFEPGREKNPAWRKKRS